MHEWMDGLVYKRQSCPLLLSVFWDHSVEESKLSLVFRYHDGGEDVFYHMFPVLVRPFVRRLSACRGSMNVHKAKPGPCRG